MDVSIIIVNYNTGEHLKECLRSILQFTKKVNFEVLVVDNNSQDRMIETLPEMFTSVKFYFRDVNDGFGAGCNFGAKPATGKYYIFVNPDIKVNSDCITDLYNYMEANKNVGACTPILKDFNGDLTYIYNNFPNFNWEFHEAMGIGNDVRIQKLLSAINPDSREALEVDWATGAFLMIRSELFKTIKSYDEDFFLYYEDTDLEYRIRKLRYKIMCLPFIEVRHFTNSSIKSDEGENIYFFHINRSKLIYMYKHFGFLKRNLIRAMHIFGIVIRWISLPFRNKFRNNRNKKLLQYKRMILLYFSSYKKVLQSTYPD